MSFLSRIIINRSPVMHFSQIWPPPPIFGFGYVSGQFGGQICLFWFWFNFSKKILLFFPVLHQNSRSSIICQPDVLTMTTITCPVVLTRWNLLQFPWGSRWPAQPRCSRCLGALVQQPNMVQSPAPPFFFVSDTKYSYFVKIFNKPPFSFCNFVQARFLLMTNNLIGTLLVLKLWTVQKNDLSKIYFRRNW